MQGIEADLALFGRLLVAALAGGLVGLERELAGKSAGLRTHMLVAMASALFVALSDVTLVVHSAGEVARGDPVRAIQAVATGIGFLGAGVMFVAEDRVHGLTTAGTIWATSAVGIAAGLSRWVLACGSALLMVLILRVFGRLERGLRRRPSPRVEDTP